MNGAGAGDGAARIATVSFGAAALGTVIVGTLRGLPLRSSLPLAAVVGVLFAAGNLVLARRRASQGDD